MIELAFVAKLRIGSEAFVWDWVDHRTFVRGCRNLTRLLGPDARFTPKPRFGVTVSAAASISASGSSASWLTGPSTSSWSRFPGRLPRCGMR